MKRGNAFESSPKRLGWLRPAVSLLRRRRKQAVDAEPGSRANINLAVGDRRDGEFDGRAGIVPHRILVARIEQSAQVGGVVGVENRSAGELEAGIVQRPQHGVAALIG